MIPNCEFLYLQGRCQLVCQRFIDRPVVLVTGLIPPALL